MTIALVGYSLNYFNELQDDSWDTIVPEKFLLSKIKDIYATS